MNRKIVESYLGKRVEIKLFNDVICKGELHKTREEKFKGDPNLYIPKNYYFTYNPHNNWVFRSSHIRSIKEIRDNA